MNSPFQHHTHGKKLGIRLRAHYVILMVRGCKFKGQRTPDILMLNPFYEVSLIGHLYDIGVFLRSREGRTLGISNHHKIITFTATNNLTMFEFLLLPSM